MMDDKDLYDRGLKLRTEIFGRDAVEKRMNAFGEFGKPLQHIINAYAYGDVWQRTALPPATKSLVMIAMMAAAKQPNELGVHLRGALEERLHGGANPGGAAVAHALLRHSVGDRRTPHRRRRAARAFGRFVNAVPPGARRD